jgi:hypothetical protein
MEKLELKKKWSKTIQFLAGYLVAAWTFLQFLDWILNRYDISPNWVDLFLWIFIGVVPSLAIYFHHQDRINDGVLKPREKILFPVNLILLAITMYFGFGNSDLGATTKEISFTNDAGELEKKRITKEEFRIGLPIFSFEQTKTDSVNQWLEYGIRELICQDLLQDKNISPYSSGTASTVDKVMQSKIFNEYYLDGIYEVTDNLYKVTPRVRNAKNGKVIAEKEFTGSNLLDLLDDVSIYVRENIGIIEEKRDFYIDLNLKDFMSTSLEAIKYSLNGEHEKAQAIDKTFAMSYLFDAERKIRYSYGSLEERNTIDEAYKYSSKLPLQRQLEIRIRKYIAYEDWDMAEKLIKLQLEIDPSDQIYNDLLYTVYGETKQVDAYVDHAEKRFNSNQSIINGGVFLNASLLVGNYKEVIDAIKNLELIQPNNKDIFTFKIRPQLLNGDIEDAKETQEKTLLINPDWEPFAKTYDIAIDYLSQNEITERKLKPFIGLFRSDSGEQTIEFWINDGILIEYVSNQRLSSPILAGERTLVDGSYINNRVTYKKDFLTNAKGETYAIRSEQYGYNGKSVFYYWAYDDAIKEAEQALNSDNISKAETLYKNLIKTRPNHYFLKEVLLHINYINSKSKAEIESEYRSIIGAYGPRKFSIENDKLYYKRENLPKTHMLPIGNNRFISLNKYGTQLAFEENDDGTIGSYALSFNQETSEWEPLRNELNYFLKDK